LVYAGAKGKREGVPVEQKITLTDKKSLGTKGKKGGI